MKAAQKHQVGVARRPKMEPTALTLLDQARARVIASRKPSLRELVTKFGSWDVPEVSGKAKA